MQAGRIAAASWFSSIQAAPPCLDPPSARPAPCTSTGGMSEGQAPRSKLEEQATSKKDLSYSYWAANAVTAAAPPPVPKKLTEEEAAAHHRETEQHREATGASAWNKAGTFEERNVTEWAKAQLRSLLVGAAAEEQQGVRVAVTDMPTCSGEAHQWLVRGKKRGGFEFELELSWRAELAQGERWAAGTAKVPEASADELDELQVLGVSVAERSEGLCEGDEALAQAVAKVALRPLLERQLRALLDALKTR